MSWRSFAGTLEISASACQAVSKTVRTGIPRVVGSAPTVSALESSLRGLEHPLGKRTAGFPPARGFKSLRFRQCYVHCGGGWNWQTPRTKDPGG